MRYLIAASGEQIFPEGGGMLIRDDDGEVIGAVGVTGDTEDRDEELAIYGIHAAGLKTDEDCADMGRRIGLIKTNPVTSRSFPAKAETQISHSRRSWITACAAMSGQ